MHEHCLPFFLPILWCTSFLPLSTLLSLTFRQRRSSQSTNSPKQEKDRGEKKFHFFVNLVSLVGLEPGDDEMMVQQMWFVGLLDGWVVGNLQTLVSDHCFVGKVIRPGQSFRMVGGRSLGGAWMRLPRPLPGIPPPCLQPSSPPHHASPISPPCFGLTTTTQPTPSLPATPAKLEWIFLNKTARHLNSRYNWYKESYLMTRASPTLTGPHNQPTHSASQPLQGWDD